MEFKYSSSSPLKSTANLLAVTVVGAPEDDKFLKALDETLGGALFTQAATEGFKGKLGQTLICYPGDALPCGALALVGAGSKKPDHPTLRHLGAYAAKAGRRIKAAELSVLLPPTTARTIEATAQLVAEGVRLGLYRFDKYKSDKSGAESPTELVTIYSDRSTGKKKGATSRGTRAAVERGQVVAEATAHARDMINEPAEFMNPSQVATIARGIAKKHENVSVKVLGVKECEKLGMGMFLGVGRGSDREPKLIHLTYKPKKKAKKVMTFIGKGVTFDTGGYSLKPSGSMMDMKVDMSGCAAVVSSMDAIATLGSPNEIHIITACCENMVSGNAYLLGDVLKCMDGTTVEINNTDAEGRLTLGDAIAYAREKTNPDEMFDFATLTGACMVALGPHTAGVMSNNEALVKRWMKACDTTGEDVWRMPLKKKLKEQLKSPIADMRNTGERWGGAITAGLFLQHFVKDTPWVHVDIAGPASVNRPYGAISKGGTGFAVATIVEYATNN